LNNPYAIDPNRICVWGQGTGGYIAFAAATLDNYSDILIPKFITQDSITGNPIPMVIEPVHGNIYGTSYGINPFSGDTLCYPNHEQYSSSFNVGVNMGGALGDSSWLDASDIPMISFHSPTDPFAPYAIGTVIVPGFNLPVVEVSGSGHVQEMIAALGLNAAFSSIEPASDIYSTQANIYNQGHYGLYPLNRPADQAADSAPWEWWLADNVNNVNGLLTNPDMSETKGMTYLDTIQGYSAQRLMCALALPGNPCNLQVLGCMDSAACNYNASADANDGSCLYEGGSCEDGSSLTIYDEVTADCACVGTDVVVGCTIPLACNYNVDANQNDGSCLFINAPCDDLDSNTVDDIVTGACLCQGTIVSVKDIISLQEKVKLYPNPSGDIINLSWSMVEKSSLSAEIFDITGKLVHTQQVVGNAAVIVVRSLEPGSYIIQIRGGSEILRSGFIKD
jgi:hypothetical protein